MKNKLITLFVSASTVLLSNAEDKPKNSIQPFTVEDLAKYDTDKSGFLSKVEYKAFIKGKKASLLEKYDTDKSGSFDDAEKEKIVASNLKERLEKYDTDKNGELDATEKKAMNLKKYDFDADGKFSPREVFIMSRGKKGVNEIK